MCVAIMEPIIHIYLFFCLSLCLSLVSPTPFLPLRSPVVCRPIIVEIRVQKGDTLETMAERYKLPVEKLIAANNGGIPFRARSFHFRIVRVF
jgi:hypothetical protein